MIIFYDKTADAWANKKLGKTYTVYDIEPEKLEALKVGDASIDPAKTTATKLAFLTKAQLQKKKDAIKHKREALEWGVKVKNYLQSFDVWLAMPKDWRDDLTELFLLVKENGNFPPLSTLKSFNADLYANLQKLIKEGKIPPPPASLL